MATYAGAAARDSERRAAGRARVRWGGGRSGDGHAGVCCVSLTGCVITQAMVAIGASSGLAGLHAAAGNAGAGVVALGWRGFWLYLAAGAAAPCR